MHLQVVEKEGLLKLVKVAWNDGKPLPVFNNAAQVVNHTMFWCVECVMGGALVLLHRAPVSKCCACAAPRASDCAVTLCPMPSTWYPVLRAYLVPCALCRLPHAARPRCTGCLGCIWCACVRGRSGPVPWWPRCACGTKNHRGSCTRSDERRSILYGTLVAHGVVALLCKLLRKGPAQGLSWACLVLHGP